ncbi:hypothetical protein [Thiomicrorhabdus xiamenensis]|uniref:Uncharacterized protein n=1 Tax=Thiomicrorhabdus xiamenensis TaxID=2739063 RepID=A0A7D4NJI2_9GAMM|nr:hypothetical protein [Thiomicrorhabdus xiamenensis]QKI88289.1 hypothetical protein HQN79_01205 [Thiomicrorhabdus xiamenensis]
MIKYITLIFAVFFSSVASCSQVFIFNDEKELSKFVDLQIMLNDIRNKQIAEGKIEGKKYRTLKKGKKLVFKAKVDNFITRGFTQKVTSFSYQVGSRSKADLKLQKRVPQKRNLIIDLEEESSPNLFARLQKNRKFITVECDGGFLKRNRDIDDPMPSLNGPVREYNKPGYREPVLFKSCKIING